MRNHKFSILLALLCLALPFRAWADPTTWALLVGISKYQNQNITTLRFPAADATSIRDALQDNTLGNLPADHIRLLTDDQATAANITDAIDSFLKPNVKPGDQVLVFLAGHGVAKGVGLDAKGYLLPTDVKGLTTAALESSAVSLKSFTSKLGQLPAGQFVIFMDACREDPTPGRGAKGNALSDVISRGAIVVPQDTTQPASSAAFFACSIGQRAFEDPSLSHGVFTYWILDGIRTAAIPKKPDGIIDMGLLSSYVRDKVTTWAKQTTEKGDFEVEQTPEFVTSELNSPIVLMKVKRPLPDTPLSAPAPILVVQAEQPGVQVSVNGVRLGNAPLRATQPQGGHYQLKIEAPGCAPIEREILLLEGYELLVTVSLKPSARGTTQPANGQAADNFKRAQEAEAQQQWEAATFGYEAAIQADPAMVPAYERLAYLRERLGKTEDAIKTLMDLVAKAPPAAHNYALLAQSYALYAEKASLAAPKKDEEKPAKRNNPLGGLFGKGKKDKPKEEPDKSEEPQETPADYGVPKTAAEARALARKAAEEAVKLGSDSAEAQRALGFALTAGATGGSGRDAALAAFGKAVFLDAKDAANYYGVGYGLRNYSRFQKEKDAQKEDLERAVTSLKQALDLRPNYYEAHRELAYCYHLMDDNKEARHEYEEANSNRGGASDQNEVAAINLSLSSLYRAAAKDATGEAKRALEAASGGYLLDAKDITPNLNVAMYILNQANLSSHVASYLPSDLTRILQLPGGINIPGFHFP